MSDFEDNKPTIKINDKVISEDQDSSFDKKLEEMKAEIEELENDFSTKTLDDLLKLHCDTPKERSSQQTMNEFGEVLEEDDHSKEK